MSTKKIPVDIWKAACENIKEPLALISPDNKFVWVNRSFEQFTGYPLAELLSMTWIDITVTDDVGGDLASVKNIINGQSNSYIMDKRYMHRRGHEIDVTIIVRRWPDEPEAIAMFYVESIPPTISKCELDSTIQELRSRILKIESDNVFKLPDTSNSNSDSSNEALKIRYFAIGFLALLGMMMYLFYCLVMLQLKQTPDAPRTSVVQTQQIEAELCLRQ